MAGISATTDLDDALADLKYHTALFHKASRNDGPAVREMLHLSFQFEAEVVEVPLEPESARFLDPNDWTASHLLARTAARSNAHAILYPTTRGRGPSLVVYRPDGISDFAAERLQLQWNGASFD